MLLVDSAIFLWLNASPASPEWMLNLALFASQQLPGLVAAGMIGAFTVGDRDIRRRVMQVLMAMGMAWTLARIGQHLIPMPRPFALGLGTQWLAHGNSAGFPSTHASVAFAFFVSVAVNSKHWVLVTAALAVACLVAWSRVCLGLHFPSDVMAGSVVGLICAQISRLVVRPALVVRRIAH